MKAVLQLFRVNTRYESGPAAAPTDGYAALNQVGIQADHWVIILHHLAVAILAEEHHLAGAATNYF